MFLTLALMFAAAAPQGGGATLDESFDCALLAIALRDDMAALGDEADEGQRAQLATATRVHAAASARIRTIVQRDKLSRARTEAVRDQAQQRVFALWDTLDESLAACGTKLGLAQP